MPIYNIQEKYIIIIVNRFNNVSFIITAVVIASDEKNRTFLLHFSNPTWSGQVRTQTLYFEMTIFTTFDHNSLT